MNNEMNKLDKFKLEILQRQYYALQQKELELRQAKQALYEDMKVIYNNYPVPKVNNDSMYLTTRKHNDRMKQEIAESLNTIHKEQGTIK